MSDPNSQPTASQPQAISAQPAVVEMHDSTSDFERWPDLIEVMKICNEVVEPAFHAADDRAELHQKIHRYVVRGVALFGTMAILFAIFELAFGDSLGLENLTYGENFALSVSLVVLVVGLLLAFQSRWLIQRTRAERLRMVKFGFVIDPELWSDYPKNLGKKTEELQAQVEEIVRLKRTRQIHAWLEEDRVPTPPNPILSVTSGPGQLDQLVDYYRTKRLEQQLNYFSKRADDHVKHHEVSKYLSAVLFLLSVLAVVLHYGYDRLFEPTTLDTASRILILLAAGFPIVGGAIRTFRSAYEFARHTYRYRAKAVALRSIESYLTHSTDARNKFLALWYTEESLENEHREWLRLMLEAEWFA